MADTVKEIMGTAQAATWLMLKLAQNAHWNRAYDVWSALDGEMGVVADVAEAAARVHALVQCLPTVELYEIDPYELYDVLAEQLIEEMIAQTPYDRAVTKAFLKTMGTLTADEQDDVEWTVEGENLGVYSTPWAAAVCFQQGQTLLGQVRLGAEIKTLVRLRWDTGEMPLWIYGAIDALSHYQRGGVVSYLREHPVRAELTPFGATWQAMAPVEIWQAGDPCDGTRLPGVVCYLHKDVWEII